MTPDVSPGATPGRFQTLPEATWPRLRALLDAHTPGGDPVNMTIGEPKHPFPDWLPDMLHSHAAEYGKYPDNNGLPELREAIAAWMGRRYGLAIEADSQVMALNGTREGLFSAALALSADEKNGRPAILLPNPFYPVYGVASLAVGAEPFYVPATAETGHLPDYEALPEDVLNRTTVAYICSPANPQGRVANADYWKRLLDLAERYDFRIFSDECYSEIYRDTPPPGGLEMAARFSADPERVISFHSLSKRSNLPGLRSGFVAGGPRSMVEIKRLRALAGAPLPNPVQRVSAAVWADEAHVVANREQYADKFRQADHIFAGIETYESPEAGFFLWLKVGEGEEFALDLWKETGVRTLPGAYLSRDVRGMNPGADYIRVALVAPMDEMTRGLRALRAHLDRKTGRG
ncbi:MAG: aminotransferase class I/II-fold pyridoxal phosphate-dependent enzyme [Pseudomonadota bacterium]